MYRFSESLVDDSEDSIESLDGGKVSDEIHGNILERALSRFERVKARMQGVCYDFSLLAGGTAFHVGVHESSKLGPPVVLLDAL